MEQKHSSFLPHRRESPSIVLDAHANQCLGRPRKACLRGDVLMKYY